jgi:hypothetical protein
VAHEQRLQGFQVMLGEFKVFHAAIVRSGGRKESRCGLILEYGPGDSVSPGIDAVV